MSKNIKVDINTEINKIAASLKTGEGGSKSDDYNKLKNKPTINGVDVVGDLTSQELGINEITAEERQKIQGLDTRFAELDNEDIKLENEINDLEDRADGVDNELDGIDQNIVTMQGNISANSTEINSLKNRVNTAESDIDDLESNMEQAQADISTNTVAISQRALISETGKLIEQEINTTTYVMTTRLKDKDGNVLSSANIDLPLESMVVNARFDSATRQIVLVLQNGTEVSFSVADLVSGLQSEITSNNKLSSDLVDDTDHAHKFVSNAEKDTWNAKYDKASTGIPKNDLSSGVQTSLDLADSSIQSDDLADYVKNTDYATAQKGGTIKGNMNGLMVNVGTGVVSANDYAYSAYENSGNSIFVGKGTLEKVITGKELVNKTYVDTIVGDIESLLSNI